MKLWTIMLCELKVEENTIIVKQAVFQGNSSTITDGLIEELLINFQENGRVPQKEVWKPLAQWSGNCFPIAFFPYWYTNGCFSEPQHQPWTHDSKVSVWLEWYEPIWKQLLCCQGRGCAGQLSKTKCLKKHS